MKFGAIALQASPIVFVVPAVSDASSCGDWRIAASTRCWTIAASVAEFGISTNFSDFQSPPFLSTQARVASVLRSLRAVTPIVLPLRSAPVFSVESGATCSSANGWRAVLMSSGATMTIGMSRRCAAKTTSVLVLASSYVPAITACVAAAPLLVGTSSTSRPTRAKIPLLTP